MERLKEIADRVGKLIKEDPQKGVLVRFNFNHMSFSVRIEPQMVSSIVNKKYQFTTLSDHSSWMHPFTIEYWNEVEPHVPWDVDEDRIIDVWKNESHNFMEKGFKNSKIFIVFPIDDIMISPEYDYMLYFYSAMAMYESIWLSFIPEDIRIGYRLLPDMQVFVTDIFDEVVKFLKMDISAIAEFLHQEYPRTEQSDFIREINLISNKSYVYITKIDFRYYIAEEYQLMMDVVFRNMISRYGYDKYFDKWEKGKYGYTRFMEYWMFNALRHIVSETKELDEITRSIVLTGGMFFIFMIYHDLEIRVINAARNDGVPENELDDIPFTINDMMYLIHHGKYMTYILPTLNIGNSKNSMLNIVESYLLDVFTKSPGTIDIIQESIFGIFVAFVKHLKYHQIEKDKVYSEIKAASKYTEKVKDDFVDSLIEAVAADKDKVYTRFKTYA